MGKWVISWVTYYDNVLHSDIITADGEMDALFQAINVMAFEMT